jgi:hypothetical protein
LRSGFEVIHRFRRLDLDSSHQLSSAIRRGQHQIGKDHHLTDPDRHRLVFADVGDDVVSALEADLKQPDDAVMLELLADRTDENGAHWTSRAAKSRAWTEKNRQL